MKFNKEIAVDLLKLVDGFSAKSFLRPNAEIFHSQWQNLIAEWLDDVPVENVLRHLYILSHSNLIFPQLQLDAIREELDAIRNSEEVQQLRDDLRNPKIVFNILKSIMQNQTLYVTIEGYKYLQNPDICCCLTIPQ